MKIFGAVGLLLAIIGLKFLMAGVFAAFESTLLKFFEFAQDAMTFGQNILQRGLP